MSQFNEREPYIIAEVGGNHGGDFETAKRYLKAAADAGVDAVKFQMYRADTLIVEDAPPLPLAGDDYDSQFERFKELEFSDNEWRELASLAHEYNIHFAASPFDRHFADMTAELSPFIKIASGEVTNIPFLRYINDIGAPVIMSTGFAKMEEIRTAVAQLSDVELTLLHCVGSYPTPDEQAHLELLDVLAEEFSVPVGYSDHTVGIQAPLAAVARDATVIEKHFTLDKSREVGDHRLSATPEEMETLVTESESIANMLDNWDRETCLDVEKDIRTEMRRSLAVSEPITAGERLTEQSLTTLRPAIGLPPARIDDVIGKRVANELEPNTILTAADIED